MTDKRVCIRHARLDDWEPLTKLIAKMVVDHSKFDPMTNTTVVGEGILHGIRSNEAVFVAEHEEELRGYVAWVHLPLSPAGLVSGLGTYVEPEYRKVGVSKLLRDAATDFCKRKGYCVVQGVAHIDNEAGLQSSLANGFYITGHLVSKNL